MATTKKPAVKKAATTVAPAAEAPPAAKEPAATPKRSLALRLLGKVAELSRRGDVTVTQRRPPWSSPIGAWEKSLPRDMFEFYKELNGYAFGFTIDGSDTWHGFNFLSLDSDGKRVIEVDRRGGAYRLPYQPAKRYPEFFFQPGEVPPDAKVLFFFGQDSGWGVLMIGEGEGATFRAWDNDGYTRPLGNSFTAVVDRLIEHGLTHTWAHEKHPNTAAALKLLAKKAPARTNYEVTVQSRAEQPEADARRALVASYDDGRRAKLARALGLTAKLKGLSQADAVALVADALGDAGALDEARAAALSRAMGLKKAQPVEWARSAFRVGTGPVVTLVLKLEYVAGAAERAPDEEDLVRALHDVEGAQVTSDFPGDPDALRMARLWQYKLQSWSPFVDSEELPAPAGEKGKASYFRVQVSEAQAKGLVAGKTYASSASTSPSAFVGS